MQVKIVYPKVKKRAPSQSAVHLVFSIIFGIAAVVCGIVNLCVGGKAWSIVVAASLLVVWRCFFMIPLIENNLISLLTRITVYTCALLVLIGVLLSPGWSEFVITVIGFSLIITLTLIFVVSFKKQKRNFITVAWVSLAALIALICSAFGLLHLGWPMIVLGSVAGGAIILGTALMRKQLLLELKKRFHR